MTMRTTLLFLSCTLFPVLTNAQCDHDPVISPSAPILCPEEDAVLSTGLFDAYQWYVNGELIPEATGQVLTVPGYDAIANTYTVAATLDGCTELSPGVLVDGWAFIPPYVIHNGDEPYAIVGEGGSQFCEGETLILTLASNYTENIQWSDGGVDIPNANGQELIVTTSGHYHVVAAPDVCPNSLMSLGVTIAVDFTPTSQAVIQENGSQLCADITGTGYTWYLSGTEIPGANTQCITYEFNGPYTVLVEQQHPCVALSEPFLFSGLHEPDATTGRAFPVPANDLVTITWENDAPAGAWRLLDAAGGTVLTGTTLGLGRMELDVRQLASGRYTLHTASRAPVPVLVGR